MQNTTLPDRERWLRWDHENLKRKAGARQSQAYRVAVVADMSRRQDADSHQTAVTVDLTVANVLLGG